uniref:Protein kinase domain-containing protein n=1 Tax=Macrostomum lignano TaxID=282301 RepID=A0A1I8FU27_9PLAT
LHPPTARRHGQQQQRLQALPPRRGRLPRQRWRLRLRLPLVVAVDDVSDSAATPGSEAAPVNGSAAGEAVGSRVGVAGAQQRARLLAHAAFPFTARRPAWPGCCAQKPGPVPHARACPAPASPPSPACSASCTPAARLLCRPLLHRPGSGAFQFDADRLKDATRGLQHTAGLRAMSCGKSPVIVDNTLMCAAGSSSSTSTWPPPLRLRAAAGCAQDSLALRRSAARQSHAALGAPRDHRAAAVQLGGGAPHLLRPVPAVRRCCPPVRLARDFLDCLASSSTGAPEPLPQLPAGVATGAEPPVPSFLRPEVQVSQAAASRVSASVAAAPPLLHATAKFCGRRGASQQELAGCAGRAGRVFHTAVSAICVTTRTVSFKMDLSSSSWPCGTMTVSENEARQARRVCRRGRAGPRHHSNRRPGCPAKQAGLDLLAALQQASQEPEPGPDELVLMTEWGFARRLRPRHLPAHPGRATDRSGHHFCVCLLTAVAWSAHYKIIAHRERTPSQFNICRMHWQQRRPNQIRNLNYGRRVAERLDRLGGKCRFIKKTFFILVCLGLQSAAAIASGPVMTLKGIALGWQLSLTNFAILRDFASKGCLPSKKASLRLLLKRLDEARCFKRHSFLAIGWSRPATKSVRLRAFREKKNYSHCTVVAKAIKTRGFFWPCTSWQRAVRDRPAHRRICIGGGCLGPNEYNGLLQQALRVYNGLLQQALRVYNGLLQGRRFRV